MGRRDLSAPAAGMLNFRPKISWRFSANHRLLQYDRPVWRTVKGGSRCYVES